MTKTIQLPKKENHQKLTIYNALAIRLGRDPTHKELCDEVRRILDDAAIERKSK